MKKILLGILPLILTSKAMKEGEEDRGKLFLDKLGLSEDVKAALNDKEKPIEDVVNLYTNNFTELTKKTYINGWDEERVGSIKKQTQIGTYNAIEKKVSEILKLKSEDYKDIDKGRLEKMLTDAATYYNSTIEELTKQANKKGGGDLETINQLKSQLQTANTQITELTASIEKHPTELEAAKRSVEDAFFLDTHINSEIEKIENILPHIDKDTIKLHLQTKAKLAVERGEDGKIKSVSISDPSTNTPYKSSPTANYTNLSLFVQKEILEPKGWIAKQNPKGDKGGVDPIKGDKGKKVWKLHPNAEKALQK